jgi:hypothetical protein
VKIEELLIPVFGAACGVAAVSFLKANIPNIYQWAAILIGLGLIAFAPKYIKEDVWRKLATYAGAALIALPVVSMVQSIKWGTVGAPPAVGQPPVLVTPVYVPPATAPAVTPAVTPVPEISVADERLKLISVSK